MEYIADSPGSSFSLGVVTNGPGRWVHTAGQVGFGPNGALVDGGIAAEADATFDRIEDIFRRAGGDLTNVVRMGVFLTSLRDYAEFTAVRKRRFPHGLPASTAVQAAGLLVGASIEIDAIAFIPADES